MCNLDTRDVDGKNLSKMQQADNSIEEIKDREYYDDRLKKQSQQNKKERCKKISHKFLNYKWIDGFETHNAILDITPYIPEYLIIGIFNPDSNDSDNSSTFFFETTYLWCALINMICKKKIETKNKKDISTKHILCICKESKITFADFISSVDSDDASLKLNEAKVLQNLANNGCVEWNTDNIIEFLKRNPSIKSIYLTRQATSVWGEQWNKIISIPSLRDRNFKIINSPARNAPVPFGERKLDYLIKQWKELNIFNEICNNEKCQFKK
jgi:hypothetical protein